jgi:hypothetical protein
VIELAKRVHVGLIVTTKTEGVKSVNNQLKVCSATAREPEKKS